MKRKRYTEQQIIKILQLDADESLLPEEWGEKEE